MSMKCVLLCIWNILRKKFQRKHQNESFTTYQWVCCTSKTRCRLGSGRWCSHILARWWSSTAFVMHRRTKIMSGRYCCNTGGKETVILEDKYLYLDGMLSYEHDYQVILDTIWRGTMYRMVRQNISNMIKFLPPNCQWRDGFTYTQFLCKSKWFSENSEHIVNRRPAGKRVP